MSVVSYQTNSGLRIVVSASNYEESRRPPTDFTKASTVRLLLFSSALNASIVAAQASGWFQWTTTTVWRWSVGAGADTHP